MLFLYKYCYAKFKTMIFRQKKITIPVLSTFLLLAILPVAIKYTAINYLQDNGAQNVKIEDIDINIFSGKIVIKGFSIKNNLQNN
ncbi:MAG: hypothetical protein ABIA04_07950 [Pseudomonadota bacterium]